MVLQYELEVLDEQISEDLHLKNLINENTSITNKQVAAWLSNALAEKNKVRKRLKPAVYSFPDEKYRKLYIGQHLSALVRMLDTLFHYLSPKEASGMMERKTDSPVERLYKKLYSYCYELLQYILDSFPEYCSDDLKIPESELVQSQYKWKTRLDNIRIQLQRKSDKKLVHLLFTILNGYCDHVHFTNLSYRTHRYINDLITGLENLKSMEKIDRHCPSLNVLLVYLDFNDTDFKDYLVESICINVNMLKTVKQKMEKLLFYYKEIGQMHKKPGVSFHPGAKSVKDDMKEWLGREIKYLEKSENLGIIVPARFQDSPQYKRGIWYNYTIEELALKKRIQYEAGYITNSNIIAMMEDLSKIAHTSTQHNISYKNLKNLFYNIDLNTIDSLHNKLLIMIRKLQDLKADVIKKQKTKRK